MAQTMKAAVCMAANEPLVIQDLPIPKPLGRQVLVRVEHASLCHSDLGTLSGAFGPVFPVVVGHEAISVIEELGPDAGSYGLKVGDRIGAGLWQDSCLKCYECRTAGSEFCKTMNVQGMTKAGYFAEYALVDAATAVVVRPAGTESSESLADLAPVFCAGITVWDALERAELKMGETIAVVGVGGLGAFAAQYAQELGARVIGLDVRDEQLMVLKERGAVNEVINTMSLNPDELARKVAEVNGGDMISKVIVASGAPAAYETALGIVKVEGLIIAVGLSYTPIPISTPDFAGRCIKLVGAKVPGQAGTKRCLDFTIRKGIRPKIHTRKFALEDINEMVTLMKEGKVEDGRMVVQFPSKDAVRGSS